LVVGIMTMPSRRIADAQVTPIAIEYGTYSGRKCWGRCAPNNWLHHRGDLDQRGQGAQRPT